MFKKILSLFLTFSITFSALTVSFYKNKVSAYDEGTDFPLIYLGGQGQVISVNENGTTRNIYPVSIPDGFIQSAVRDNIGVFVKAVLTQEWNEFGEVMHNLIYQLYHELALDENGNPINGSYCYNSINNNIINSARLCGNQYITTQFTFYYDWRLDPYKIADELHSYIQKVIDATGYNHVGLIGRCMGACVAAAYMEKYDGEYISDLIVYSSAINGSTILSKMFAGEAYLDADGIERFVYDLQLSSDELINDLIKSFVSVANDTYGLDLLCDAFNNVIDNIYLDIFPQILVDTMGTWPGFWSMVSDEDYERAKDTVFHNKDINQYSSFIKIIDNYHYNVQVKVSDNFKKYIDNGIEIANITKFGYQTIPATYDADIISDGLCSVTDSSMGATTASILSTFSDDYISSATLSGSDIYISPDFKIDASTCLLPDRTWFIGNLYHKDFPDVVNYLINKIINYDGVTTSNCEFQQYMIYEDGNLSQMTAENMSIIQEKYNHTFSERFITFIKTLIRILFNTLSIKTT